MDEDDVWTGVWVTRYEVKKATVAVGDTYDIKVGDAKYALVDVDTLTISAKEYSRLDNAPIYELPNTGGPGTYIFTILGTMLMVLSAFFIHRLSKTRGKEKAKA